jgi:hypothetical protein
MRTLRGAAKRRLRAAPAALGLTALALLATTAVSGGAQDRAQRQPPSISTRDASPSTDSGRHAVPSAPDRPAPQAGGSSGGGDRGDRGDRGGRGGDEPRTARPVDRSPDGGGSSGGFPSRQPPTRSGRGRDHGHHGSHGYYGYGGSRYYDPFYPYYWGPYPYYGWGSWGYPYIYGPGGYYYRGDGRSRDEGALDMDVWPGDTQVYLDGQNIGTVDAFDGWPQYLWLEKGTYDVVLFRAGYRTVAKQISVYPGVVISVNDRLEQGESVPAEQMFTPRTTERRDARVRADREREEELRDGRDGGRDDEWESWRDRLRSERRGDDYDRDDRDDRADRDRDDEGDETQLQLEVEPEDASIYIDGRFVGTAEQLADDDGIVELPPGRHKVSVVRPGRNPKEVTVNLEPGEKQKLEVNLDEAD